MKGAERAKILNSRAHAEGVNAAAVHRRCVRACAKARALLYDAAVPFAQIDGGCENELEKVLGSINAFEKAIDETKQYLDEPPGSE